MKSDEEIREQLGDLIKRHVTELAQHFDNVIILANSHNGAGHVTDFWDRSSGNVFALEGQVRRWLNYKPTSPPDDNEDDES